MRTDEKVAYEIQFTDLAEIKRLYDSLIYLQYKRRTKEAKELIEVLHGWLENNGGFDE